MQVRPWVLVVAGVLSAGCSERHAPSREAPPEQSADRVKALGSAADRAQALPASAPAAAQPAPDPAALMLAARKLIRSGQVTIEVARYASAAEAIARLADSQGGYVADTRSAKSDEGKERGTITIRIPAERFGAALAALKTLGSVKAESVSTQDVTKAYADLETRLRVKREALERLRAILRTQTGKLSDVIEAEREIARVTEEIEELEGERRFYDQQVALSTLTVELREPEPLLHGGAFEPVREAFSRSLEVLAESVAAVIYVGVFALPWLFVLWLLWRIARALRARGKRAAS